MDMKGKLPGMCMVQGISTKCRMVGWRGYRHRATVFGELAVHVADPGRSRLARVMSHETAGQLMTGQLAYLQLTIISMTGHGL